MKKLSICVMFFTFIISFLSGKAFSQNADAGKPQKPYEVLMNEHRHTCYEDKNTERYGKGPCSNAIQDATSPDDKIEFLLAACVRETNCDPLLNCDLENSACFPSNSKDSQTSIYRNSLFHWAVHMSAGGLDPIGKFSGPERLVQMDYFRKFCEGVKDGLPLPVSKYFSTTKLDLNLISHKKVKNGVEISRFQGMACIQYDELRKEAKKNPTLRRCFTDVIDNGIPHRMCK
jgi:hypothetical protein